MGTYMIHKDFFFQTEEAIATSGIRDYKHEDQRQLLSTWFFDLFQPWIPLGDAPFSSLK